MSVDVIGALVDVLQNDAAVSALVGAKVFGKELPASEAGNARKAVVLQPSGGVPFDGGFTDHTAQRFDAISYGETPFEASRVEGAVFDAMKQLRRQVAAGVLVHSVNEAGGYTSGRDRDTDWPLDARTYQVLYATVAC